MKKNTPAVVKGYRLPLFGLFADRSSKKPVVIKIKPQCEQINDQEGAVENQVCRPVHATQYSAAGAGYLFPVTQLDQANIAGKKQQQEKGCFQASKQCPVKQKQRCRRQFCQGQQVQQYIRNSMRERLPVKFPPERPKIDQLAESRVDKKQYQQRD